MPKEPPKPIGAPPPAVGVLFVHGAGDHPVGSTLVEFRQPLIAWLDGWLSAGRSASEVQATDRVRPGAAQLLTREADQSAPAHVEIELRSRTDPQPRRWLFAESRWDQAFVPPSFQQVLTWALTAVPWTVLTQFLGPLSDKASQLRPSIPSVVRFVVEAILALALIVIASVLLQALAIAILILSVIPLDPIRNVVGRLQRFASTSVGDLYIVLMSPVQRAALAGAVQRDVAWLRSRGCGKVVVVAHSQGGFVAHQALTDPWHPPIDLFVTLGSGLIRLTESERARRTHMLVPALIGLLGFLLFVRFAPSTILGTTGFTQRHPAVGLAAEIGFVMMLVAIIPIRRYLQLRRSREPSVARSPIAGMPAGTRWVDFVTAEDPVLNGQRAGRLPADAVPIDVENRGSVIADHGSYWDNTDQFVAQVALEIGMQDPPLQLQVSGPAGTEAEVREGLERSWTARQARVDVLERVRLVFGAAVLALIVGHWARLSVIGAPIAKAVGNLPHEVRDVGGPLVDAIVPVAVSHATLLGLLAVALVAAAGYRLAVTAWDAWGDDDTVSQWRGEPADPLAGGAVAFHALAAAMFAFVALVAWYGPSGVVHSLEWIRDWRDPITQAFVGTVAGSLPVAGLALFVAVRPMWPKLDEPRVAKVIVGICLAVLFDLTLAAAAPGRRWENLLYGAIIAVATIEFTVGPLTPLARLTARLAGSLRVRADRPLGGSPAGLADVWWLGSLALVVVIVPLVLRGTGISTVLGVLCGISALGFGIQSAAHGHAREIRVAGMAAAMLATTMASVAAAHWVAVAR